MESEEVLERIKQELGEIYQSLNHAELKGAIDKKIDLLYRVY